MEMRKRRRSNAEKAFMICLPKAPPMVNTHSPAPALKNGFRNNVPTVRFTALLLPLVSWSHPYGNNEESSIGALLLCVMLLLLLLLLLLLPLSNDANMSVLLLLVVMLLLLLFVSEEDVNVQLSACTFSFTLALLAKALNKLMRYNNNTCKKRGKNSLI